MNEPKIIGVGVKQQQPSDEPTNQHNTTQHTTTTRRGEKKSERSSQMMDKQESQTLITSSSSSSSSSSSTPLLSFHVTRLGCHCPFANEHVEFHVWEQSCIWLTGNSGLGKTTLVSYLAGLTSRSDLQQLDIDCIKCQWDPTLSPSERCGILFQQTTLLDALTVAGNLRVALLSKKTRSNNNNKANQRQQQQPTTKIQLDNSGNDYLPTIKHFMELVGLDYARDANKKPTELSGGMARRASLALQLVQNKHVIVLDEPFAGLDRQAALSVAMELWHLRNHKQQQTAIVLISHEPEYAKIVMTGRGGGAAAATAAAGGGIEEQDDDDDDKAQATGLHNTTVTLTAPNNTKSLMGDNSRCDLSFSSTSSSSSSSLPKPNLFGVSWLHRFVEKLMDYIFWSIPLIALTFCACGLAIAMLSCDSLARIDVTDQVMDVLDTEVKPFLKFLTGQEDNTMAYLMIKMKVNNMINTTLPKAKATLFAVGMAHLFCLEIGPLLTALLLCGRIGASYAGKVATMQATKQLALLQTMGISPLAWTLYPALVAASVAAPLLTLLGTVIALALGGLVALQYEILPTWQDYQDKVQEAIFPPWRIQLWQWVVVGVKGDNEDGDDDGNGTWMLHVHTSITRTSRNGNDTTTGTDDDSFLWRWYEVLIEFTTYPLCFLLLKSITYILIILLVAQTSTALRPKLTPRGVPMVITSSVVVASMLVIVADWAFSQLWLRRV